MGKKSKLKKLAARLGKLEQVAALPYRLGRQGIEILVITSRRTQRLIIPKGWPSPGIADAAAAANEANEEAGVKGRVAEHPIGSFDYMKALGNDVIRVTASVFPLQVTKIKSSWKERKQRKRTWMPIERAARELDDADLGLLVRMNSEQLR
jgi:8-oxo-dGTP pyrophosphatase MutT (NUDIX family)